MEAAQRDTTDEWRVAPGRTPATVAELEGRIDVAMATAQAAEEAALEIGAASLEAADQARRAAALAEKASAAAVRAADRAPTAPASSAPAAPADPPRSIAAVPTTTATAPTRPDPFEERITAFRQRAERVIVRLQKIEAGAAPGDGPSEVVRLR
jgi:hypothetical protein